MVFIYIGAFVISITIIALQIAFLISVPSRLEDIAEYLREIADRM